MCGGGGGGGGETEGEGSGGGEENRSVYRQCPTLSDQPS